MFFPQPSQHYNQNAFCFAGVQFSVCDSNLTLLGLDFELNSILETTNFLSTIFSVVEPCFEKTWAQENCLFPLFLIKKNNSRTMQQISSLVAPNPRSSFNSSTSLKLDPLCSLKPQTLPRALGGKLLTLYLSQFSKTQITRLMKFL